MLGDCSTAVVMERRSSRLPLLVHSAAGCGLTAVEAAAVPDAVRCGAQLPPRVSPGCSWNRAEVWICSKAAGTASAAATETAKAAVCQLPRVLSGVEMTGNPGAELRLMATAADGCGASSGAQERPTLLLWPPWGCSSSSSLTTVRLPLRTTSPVSHRPPTTMETGVEGRASPARCARMGLDCCSTDGGIPRGSAPLEPRFSAPLAAAAAATPVPRAALLLLQLSRDALQLPPADGRSRCARPAPSQPLLLLAPPPPHRGLQRKKPTADSTP